MAEKDILDYQDDDKTTIRDIVGLASLVCYSAYDELRIFLLTHPVPTGVKNLLSVIIGDGGTIGFTKPIKAIKEGWDGVIEAAGLK